MSSWREKLSGYLVWAVCAAYIGLFFDITISNITLFILLGCCLLILTIPRFVAAIKSSISVQLLIAFYLLHVVGLLYSENLNYGFFVLEKKATLLAMPLIFFPALQYLSKDERASLLFWLGIITVLSSFVFLGIATFKAVTCHDPLAFHRDYFASIPYVFYSIYFATGCLLLLYSLYERLSPGNTRVVILLIVIIYSLGLLVLISSKTGIIAYVIALIYFLYIKLRSKRLFFMSMAGVLFSLAMLLVLYPTTLHRFTELTGNLAVVREDTLKDYQEFNGLNLRLYFWKTSVTQLYADNRLVAGVGTGDGQDYLDQAYIKRHLDLYGYLGFDPHNQWVITLLQLGLIGVALLGSVFLFGCRKAYKTNNLAFIFFAWVLFCFSLSESILEANKGVVFFALFFCVLCAPARNKVTGGG